MFVFTKKKKKKENLGAGMDAAVARRAESWRIERDIFLFSNHCPGSKLSEYFCSLSPGLWHGR